jgi:hypothetical protein
MKRYSEEERIREELQRGADFLGPVDDPFYRAVWRRIAAHPRNIPKASWGRALEELGLACWRAVPACLLLVISIGGYLFYNPPESFPEVMSSAESFILDLEDAPVNEVVLYQIMNVTPDSTQEVRP